jgi:hypothetical protein
VNVGPLLVSNTEPTKLIQPSESSLHDPAPPAQPTAVLRVAHREQRYDVGVRAEAAESVSHHK